MNLASLPLQAVFVEAKEKTTAANARLLIVLHGRGDSPKGFSWMPETMDLPQLNYLFLQAPDDYYGGYSWYGMPPNQLPGILRSRALLEQTVKAIFDQGYRSQNIFLFGFSQGCLMTLEFGERFPVKFRGYIGVSGYVYDAKLLTVEADYQVKQGDWLVTHGTRDEVLEVSKTREQIKALQDAGFQIDYREYVKGHTIDEREELPLIRKWLAERF